MRTSQRPRKKTLPLRKPRADRVQSRAQNRSQSRSQNLVPNPKTKISALALEVVSAAEAAPDPASARHLAIRNARVPAPSLVIGNDRAHVTVADLARSADPAHGTGGRVPAIDGAALASAGLAVDAARARPSAGGAHRHPAGA